VKDKPPKKTGERPKQDLSNITPPDKTDYRKSSDQQLLADVLLKKIPVADLIMADHALGNYKPSNRFGSRYPVLVDDKGFINHIMGVDSSHVMGFAASDSPEPFNPPMDPRLAFDMGVLSNLKNTPTPERSFLQRPTKKTVVDSMIRDDPIEGTGFFVRDGDELRQMTREEAEKIYDEQRTEPNSKKKKPQPKADLRSKIEFATPFWDARSQLWNLPYIHQQGKPSDFPRAVFNDAMFQTSEGAIPDDELSFFMDPRQTQFGSSKLQAVKDVASVTPKEFKSIIGDAKSKAGFVRIGDSAFELDRLQRLSSGIKNVSHMADEDVVVSAANDVPVFISGRGVKRYDEEPTFWEAMIAPRIVDRGESPDDDSAWWNMDDIFG
jgi:hypothetical protein